MPGSTPGSLPELDPVIHAQARLRVSVALAALPTGDQITFPRLQHLLQMSAGNLSTHLRKLEDASYVQLIKTHQRRTPVTYVWLTRTGRRALEDYTVALRRLLTPPPTSREAEVETLARTVNATRSYGPVIALDGVSLDVPAGQLLGVLGPNGAGKTTLLHLLAGLRRPTSGTVELFGGDPRVAARRRRLGCTPQETGLPATLRVHEIVEFVGGRFADPVPVAELLDQFGLTGLERRQSGGLSGGQRRRLAVAVAFVGRPDLVLLDEPTTGLDVQARHSLWGAVRRYHQGGGTVVLTSHYLEEVEVLAERVVVINQGRVRADGTIAEVRSRVPARRVRLRAPDLPQLAGVERSRRDGDRYELWTADSDSLVRELIHTAASFKDLEVASASLEEAFLALTSSGSRTSTPTATTEEMAR
jgi:ABC-2 type transport system ATP-binding protein